MKLETKHAGQIIDFLLKAQQNGEHFVLVSFRPGDEHLNVSHLELYADRGRAMDAADDRELIGGGMAGDERLLYCTSVADLLAKVSADNGLYFKDLEQAVLELRDHGYHEWIVDELAERYQRNGGTGPMADHYRFGEDKLNINWNFQFDGQGGISHPVLMISLVQVSIEHWAVSRTYDHLPLLDRAYGELRVLLDAKLKQQHVLPINNQAMNLNNLQDLQREAGMLGFSQQTIDQLETNMKTGAGYFNIRETLPGDNGLPVDLTLHLRKSAESEYYNFNKFEAVAGKVPPAPAGQQYMVMTADKENPSKILVKKFDSGLDAIDFFKKYKGTSELNIGEGPEAKHLLASKMNGTLNYVNNDFRQAYYGAAVSQTFYLQKGVGFSAQQAANMVQGRTVHRDNMLNPTTGEVYKAWIKLDFELPKDDYGNHKLKQMNDPNFGFDLDKTLNKFKIKELADPQQKENIMNAVRNGDRIDVTVTGKDNKDQKVQLEAQPRYKTMDFYSPSGERLKREAFLKAPSNNLDLGKDQGKAKDKDKGEDLGIAV